VKSSGWKDVLVWCILAILAVTLARETRIAYQKDQQFRERYIQMEQSR
jgi:hypothetical protein